MADTVLDYSATLNLDSDQSEDGSEEEEYDAKNDETFGELEDAAKEDWEEQHEHFAEIEELTKLSESFENTKLELPGLFNGSVWTYKEEKNEPNRNVTTTKPTQHIQQHDLPRKICTVEELERNLLNSKPKPPPNLPAPPPLLPPRYPGMFQGPRVPPGLPPPPAFRPPMHQMGPYGVAPGVMRVMLPPHQQPPGFMFHGNSQFPIGHPFNFPPPPQRHNFPQQQQQQFQNTNHRMTYPQQQQPQRFEPSNGYRNNQQPNRPQQHQQVQRRDDEYAGLMSNREKQWLLNIQMLQLNTGTPYFDDHYYTVYKSRRKQQPTSNNERGFGGNRSGDNRNNRGNRQQDNQNQLTPRVYTPLQFENSLGKLQCGSVTAPRKIIDMDVVAPDKDSEAPSVARDTRRSKQLLLELEALYTLFLKASDLSNPMAIADTEKLRAMKQKQRLRELEAAQTPEAKKEILDLLRKESGPEPADERELLGKVVAGLLREEKFAGYFRFSKGKMLVLRVLGRMRGCGWGKEVRDVWCKVLLSIPVVGRRDAAGDNVLPKFYPTFKSHIEVFSMSEMLELVVSLTEIVKQETNRGTPCPISHQGKSPLHFIIFNKFGISAVCALLRRAETLLSTADECTPSEDAEWGRFVTTLVELARTNVGTTTERAPPEPIERIPGELLSKHLDRYVTDEKKSLLECMLADTNPLLYL